MLHPGHQHSRHIYSAAQTCRPLAPSRFSTNILNAAQNGRRSARSTTPDQHLSEPNKSWRGSRHNRASTQPALHTTAAPAPPPLQQPDEPMLAKLQLLLQHHQLLTKQGPQAMATPATQPTAAAVRAAMTHLSGFAPDTYQLLMRAAAAMLRPDYPSLPPPYAGLAGQRNRSPAGSTASKDTFLRTNARTAQARSTGMQPASQAHAGPLPQAVQQLTKKLAELLGTDAARLLEAAAATEQVTMDTVPHKQSDASNQPTPISTDRARQKWQRNPASTHSARRRLDGDGEDNMQLLDPEELQVAAERALEGEEDGGPPIGSLERVLWEQAATEGHRVYVKPVLLTVPGWVDLPYLQPACPPRIPHTLYQRGRELQPPALRWPDSSTSTLAGPSTRAQPRVGRVFWVLTQQDLQQLLQTAQSMQGLVSALMGWKEAGPVDGLGPLLPAGSNQHEQHKQPVGASAPSNRQQSSGTESALVVAVRNAVHACHMTLSSLYFDSLEVHVYAPASVLQQPIGLAWLRTGVTSLDTVRHSLSHLARVRRLYRRRRRDWRLLARARAMRAALRLPGVQRPPASPYRTAAEASDELDAWADHLSHDPDYPTVLAGIPEKDLIHAATTGSLPPRYKRVSLSRSKGVLNSSRKPKGAKQQAGTQPAASQQQQEQQQQQQQDFEVQVLQGLDRLKARLAMPWVDAPGTCELKQVTLQQLLLAYGVFPHAAPEANQPDQPGSLSVNTTARKQAISLAVRDMQALMQLTARHWPSAVRMQTASASAAPHADLLHMQQQLGLLSTPSQHTQPAASRAPARFGIVLVGREITDNNVQDILGQARQLQVATVLACDSISQQQTGADAYLSWSGLLRGAYLPGSGGTAGRAAGAVKY